MDEEYERNVERVMAYLAERAASEWTTRRYRDCFACLGEHMRESGLRYSDGIAWDWLGGISPKLERTTLTIYAAALGKLADLYATGEIKARHSRKARNEERLSARHARVVDGYCAHLRDAGMASATVRNHRYAAIRFLLSLQDAGVAYVADATYDDVTRVLLACDDLSHRARTDYRGKIRSILAWLHSVGLARFGFTLLADATSLKKGYCWNDVDPEVVEELRGRQAADGGATALDDYLEFVEVLVDEYRAGGYSDSPTRSIAHFGRLLYLFMDANGLLYDPAVGRAWMGSMERSLARGEFLTCRRTVLLLEQSHEGVAHDLRRAFDFGGKTLRDRLPEWCAPQVDAFLAQKAAEGWKRSTIDMFRTCVCRFCIAVDAFGVASFGEVTVEHVKRFNVEDPHETPEAKNAFNSRIRRFLEWLGERGELSSAHLHLALPNVAAPREELVVTLTDGERSELEAALGSGAQSLRDKAMLELGLRMGVRACDVVGLVADDIRWDDSTLRVVQAKTGYEVDLPMPADVGNALYRYIVAERPESTDRAVFLGRNAPHAPLGAGTAQTALRRALPDRDVPGSGFHVLRKTFASNMLRGGAAPTQVAEALGHRGMDNVRKYLHLDDGRMRLCGLSLEEAGLVPEGGLFDGR